MPHEWNSIIVVTELELVPAHYNTSVALRVALHRFKDKAYGIKKVQSGGNGRQMLISFDSLPKEIQDAIGDPRKPGHILELFYTVDNEAVRYFTQDFYKHHGFYLSFNHQDEYITNASVLKACVALKAARENERRTKGGSLRGVMDTVAADAVSFNKTLKQKHGSEHTLPTSAKRFKKAFSEFSKPGGFNYASLISGKLKNTNAKVVTDEYLGLLNGLFAGTSRKPTRTEVSRQFDAFLAGYIEVVKDDGSGEMYDPKEFKRLSDSTIINYLGSWEEKIGTYAKRSGDRQKLMQAFKPYHSLDKPEFAGSIISIDDRQPPFEYSKGNRMWFYNAIDLGSEAFTCWVYGKSKDGIIVEFYRQLIRNYTEWGFCLPAELECESSLNSHFKDTFLRQGAMFDTVRIEANNARGKRIEAYYKPLRYNHEKEREGWLARPFALSESNQKSNEKVPLVPYNEIVEGCLRDIEDWNNMPHAVHTDKTRWEVFCEMQHPALKPTNWKAILPYLGYCTQTSCNAGIIKLQGREFLLGDCGDLYFGEHLVNLMKQVEGKSIDVYWLDDNEGNVMKAVVFAGDKCICEAIPKPRYNRATIERTAEDEVAREMMSKYVATIESYMRQKAASIERVVVIDNREKTLNRKFVMPNLSARYEAKEEAPEVLPELPEETDEVLMPVENNRFVRPQIDRF